MRKTRFVAQDPQQVQFAAALRRNVNDYFREENLSSKANFAVAMQTLNMSALYAVPYVLMLVLPMPEWLAALMALISGIGLAGIGMCVMHGGAHDAISDQKWLNALLAGSMNLLGNSVYTWKVKHNMLHHTFTNIAGLDDDIANKGPLRLCASTPIRSFHYYQHVLGIFLYGFLTISMLVKDFTNLIQYRKMGILQKQKVSFAREMTKVALLKVIHIGIFFVLPMLFTDLAIWQIALNWLVMHFTGGFILGLVFQLAHVVEGVDQPVPSAEGVIHDDWVIHELHTTSNFAPHNPLLNWYIGGLNYQIEHHLFPNICHIHYPKIAPIVEATAKQYGYPYIVKRTFWDAITSHIRTLKALGRKAPAVSGALVKTPLVAQRQRGLA
jgi:linoleoyl-CoA desaturase